MWLKVRIIRICLLLLSAAGSAFPQSRYDELVSQARTAISDSQYQNAVTRSQEAVALDGKRWEGYAAAGTALSLLGRSDEAVLMFAKAAARAPADKAPVLEKMMQEAQTQGRTQGKAQGQQPASPASCSILDPSNLLDQINRVGEGMGWPRFKDYAEAFAGLRSFAPLPATTNFLGFLYLLGKGTPVDYSKAMSLFRSVAENGISNAAMTLGVMYLIGCGVGVDYAQAMFWCRKSADKLNPTGMYYIGYLYEQGLGVQANRDEAIRWYTKSVAFGRDPGDEFKRLSVAPPVPGPAVPPRVYVHGVVLDSNFQPIAGARIDFTQKQTGELYGTNTNPAGFFELTLPPGDYIRRYAEPVNGSGGMVSFRPVIPSDSVSLPVNARGFGEAEMDAVAPRR